MNHRLAPTIAAEDLAEIRRPHDFDSADAAYQPELLAFARPAERVASALERILGDAGPILAGLRLLCVERAAVTQRDLSPAEFRQLDAVLAALGDSYDASDWADSLRTCLCG
jgi:hypothetical protein